MLSAVTNGIFIEHTCRLHEGGGFPPMSGDIVGYFSSLSRVTKKNICAFVGEIFVQISMALLNGKNSCSCD